MTAEGRLAIGVLGGSFDPIHWGHLRLADEAAKVWPLDRVLFVPARVSPLKQGSPPASPEDRLAMIEAAIAGRAPFAVSRVELERPGPSFMVDTLRILQAQHPEARLVLLMGMDAFRTFTQWKDWREITALSDLLVASRPGEPKVMPPQLGSLEPITSGYKLPSGRELRFFDMTPVPISSTQIRERVRRGESITGLVPEPVERIVRERGLYLH